MTPAALALAALTMAAPVDSVVMKLPETVVTGTRLPFGGLDQPARSIGMGIAHIAIFLAKLLCFMGLIIWVRWMWPRFRYDQLMDLGWRRFIPVALANILVTAVWLWWQSGK